MSSTSSTNKITKTVYHVGGMGEKMHCVRNIFCCVFNVCYLEVGSNQLHTFQFYIVVVGLGRINK
jgi:hypothetical protein